LRYHQSGKGESHARTGNSRAGPRRPARGQVALDPSRRVCARGDPPRPRREAWRSIDQTNHRHRPIEGQASRCRLAATEEGQDYGPDTSKRRTSLCAGTWRTTETSALGQAFARDCSRPSTRRNIHWSHASLSKQAHAAARQRTADERSAAAQKAVRAKGPAKRHAAAMKAVETKGHMGLSRAARKAARTRAAT
jgi:hypothetical protein